MRRIFLTVILAFLLFAGTAFAQYTDITISPDYRDVYMGRNDSSSVVFTIENVGDERVYIDLTSYDNSAYVMTRLSREDFDLYENESTSVTMTIKTEDAPRGTYTATLRARYDGEVETSAVYIHVTDGTYPYPGIELIQETFPNVCRGEKGEISYEIRNNTHRTIHVELRSGEFRGVPTYFEPDEVWVSPNRSEYVDLIIPATTGISYGDYSVKVYAYTSSGTFTDYAYFDLVKCEYPTSAEFSLTLSSSCKYVDKGDEVKISYYLRNRTNDDIKVELALVSDLPTDIDEPVYLDAYEYESDYFKVKTRESDETGKHKIKMHAWTDDYSVEKETCVYIRKEHESGTSLLSNNLVIERGTSEVFRLLVKNTGDYDEDYDVEVSNPYTGIGVAISDKHFDLDDGEEKEISITVATAEDAGLGSYSLTLIVSNRETFEETLSFSVVEVQPVVVYPVVNVVSMPAEITLKSGEEKGFTVVVENTTSEPITNLRISLVDAPFGVSVSAPTIDLRAGETRNISGTIKVAEDVPAGLYTASLQFKSADFATEKAIDVKVEKEEAVEVEGEFFAGLFSLGGSIALGLIVLIIAIVAVVLLTRYAEGKGKKQVWEKK